MLTQAAPQLNLFGIGFPITIGVGFIMIGITLLYLATPLSHLLQEVIRMIRQLSTVRWLQGDAAGLVYCQTDNLLLHCGH